MTTDVQSYAFGRGELQAPVMLSGLDRLGDKLGRRIRALIEPIAGVRPNVEAQDARADQAVPEQPRLRLRDQGGGEAGVAPLRAAGHLAECDCADRKTLRLIGCCEDVRCKRDAKLHAPEMRGQVPIK